MSFSQKLDALLENETPEIDLEIEKTERRLTLLKALRGCGAPKSVADVFAPPKVKKAAKKPGRNPNGAKFEPAEALKLATGPARSMGQMDDLAFKAGAFLKREGPRRSDAIRNHLNIDYATCEELLKRPWFEKDGVRWRLSSDGEIEFQPTEP